MLYITFYSYISSNFPPRTSLASFSIPPLFVPFTSHIQIYLSYVASLGEIHASLAFENLLILFPTYKRKLISFSLLIKTTLALAE
ncbi:hypothetical protein CW304_24800 [Bacillus sp. UFRGS-B20]|nr:hypothetical protein CW304_24800 [Bacillus sp. UFRGS-B20]